MQRPDPLNRGPLACRKMIAVGLRPAAAHPALLNFHDQVVVHVDVPFEGFFDIRTDFPVAALFRKFNIDLVVDRRHAFDPFGHRP